MWLNEVDNIAMEQIIRLASLPFAYKHIAIMPDAHAGAGMPIGGVLATDHVIVPNAVGVDIGCGMCAIRTSLKREEITHDVLRNIISEKIKQIIPFGFEHQKSLQDEKNMPVEFDIDKLPKTRSLYKAARLQLGTLGGGNHFIEIQKATGTNDVWIMLHSGSRNIGLKVAGHYEKIAQRLNNIWFSQTSTGLEFLPIECQEAKDYFNEMKYCMAYAFANRKLMMERIQEIFVDIFPNVSFDPMINIAHNYAAWENHFGHNVIVHRKGATRAYKGEIGIIPGSQGSKSYIVEGLGNTQSFMSCSHGAGRKMGRKEAVRSLSLENEVNKMNAQGIVHFMSDLKDLDEAAGAYKDINEVLSNESDLVRPIIELSPLAVLKG